MHPPVMGGAERGQVLESVFATFAHGDLVMDLGPPRLIAAAVL